MQIGLVRLVLVAAAAAAVSEVEGDELEYVLTTSRLPTPRQWVVAVYDGRDSIYAVGGWTGSLSVDQVVKYSIESDSVQVLEPFVPRHVGAAVMHGDDIIYFGGMNSATYQSGIYRFSTMTGSTSRVSSLPSPAGYFQAAWDDVQEVAYIIGGTRGSDQRNDWVLQFNATSNIVTEVTTLPEARYGAGAVWDSHLGVVHIIGGYAGGSWRVDILHYYPVTNSVSLSETKLPYAMSYPRSVMVGRQIYNFDRYGLLVYKPDSEEVEIVSITGYPTGVYYASYVYVPKVDRIYVFGGLIGENYRDDIAYIQLQTAATTTTPTTEDPTSTTEVPTTTEEDPTSTTEDPTTTTEEPTTTEEDPTSTTEDPTSTSIPTTEGPTSTPAPTTTEGTTTEDPPPPLPSTTVDPLNPTVCNETDKYETQYITTAGNRATAPCPGGSSNGTATWYCTSDGTFAGSQPDYSNCTNGWLPDIREELPAPGETLNGTYARRLLNDLQKNVENAAQFETSNVTYFGHEIEAIFHVGAAILQATNVSSTTVTQREELTTTTFAVYSKVIAFRSPWDELDDDNEGAGRAATATAFIAWSELSSLTLAAHQAQYRHEFKGQEEFQVLAGAETAWTTRAGPFGVGTGTHLQFPLNPDRTKDSYIEIPPSWANNYPPGTLVPFGGLRLQAIHANFLFTPPQERDTEASEGEGGGTILNGPLLAFTFDEEGVAGRRLNFSEGVRITFQHDVHAWGGARQKIRRKLHSADGERPKAASASAKCAYWDTPALKWSTSGCARISTSRDTTVCECNHLTSFALIMDLHQYIGADKALEVLTLILTPLSTLGLLAYIILFVYYRKKQRLMSNHPRNEITLGLCSALLVSNLLIMVTLDRNYLYLSEGACAAFAMALHYSLVCAFAWMGLEGVLLARLILFDVFSSGREHVRLERVGAFLVPAVVVGATIALDYGQRNGEGDDDGGGVSPAYGGDAYCWLNGGYLWAFLGPVALVVSFNSVALVLAVRKSHVLQNTRARKGSVTPGVKKRARALALWLQGALNLTALMGITWVAGFLMLAENETVARLAAYAFTLFNASQGIFIFGFHVAANKGIRRKLSVFATKSTSVGGGAGGGGTGAAGVAAGRENSRSGFNSSSKTQANGTSGTKLHSSSNYS